MDWLKFCCMVYVWLCGYITPSPRGELRPVCACLRSFLENIHAKKASSVDFDATGRYSGIPPASGDRWFRVCFWSLSNIPPFFQHFQHSSFLKGGVYPSLYPSPWSKNDGVYPRRLVSFPLLADFLALHFLTFLCDPLFISFGAFLAPF